MNSQKYIEKEQKRIHRLVTQKFPDYYLTGGTALAFYFRHRFSEDLDFFTQNYRASKAGEIMKFIGEKTGYAFDLTFEQNNPQFLPMRMYMMAIGRELTLKIDIVQDPHKNIQKIKDGTHSLDDIYYRKIFITLDPYHADVDETGRGITMARREAKDIFDIYYLSTHYEALNDFFIRHFPSKLFARMDSWYRSLDRRDIMIELSERVENVDPKQVLKHLDGQILNGLGETHHD